MQATVNKQQPITLGNQKHQLFDQLCPGIGAGLSVPEGWKPLTNQPLLIIVGVTGVGKSTTTAALAEVGLAFTLLPNRRTLTDRLVIAPMLKAKGEWVQPLCRIERLTYTRRYRERFPGGMAHTLTQLKVDPEQIAPLAVFDGLRGENEVRYAAAAISQAKFVVLDAPERVRLERLLSRNDAFDQVAKFGLPADVAVETQAVGSFAALGVPEACNIFIPQEEQELLALAREGVVTSADLRDKLKILVEERQNYDPVATRRALQAIAPQRTLVIDTATYTPHQAAQVIRDFVIF